jgi:tetratricopeptide (TPR) repeat protein
MTRPSPPPAPPAVGRRRLFAAITLALPVVILLLLEGGLRLFGYGGDQRLVIRTVRGGSEVFQINRTVAHRYFAQAGTAVPEPADETFAVVKPPKTRRIFCLGESTMAGFPYEFHATPSSLLRDRLERLLPDSDVEVINIGVSAVGSYVVEDFTREILDYDPDLILYYLGHNEFYGIYGVGSSVAVKGGAWMTRLTIRLLRFRTFLLLRDTYAAVLRWFAPPAAGEGGSLMGQMVGRGAIAYGGTEYRAAREVYAENLRRIMGLARERGVPVMFSALVSNVRSMPPFVSVSDSTAAPEAIRELAGSLAEGDAALSGGDTLRASAAFAEAMRLDTLNARAAFGAGVSEWGMGRHERARQAFLRAKDLDGLRFRATEDFQRVLRAECAAARVPVAPVDSAFAARSPYGTVGDEWILEHLHPNLDGYALMAESWQEEIRRRGLLVPADSWVDSLDPGPGGWIDLALVAEFDRALGRVKTELLKRRWPFAQGETDYQFTPATPEESVVFAYVQKQISWSDARYRLAEHYAGRREFALARKECLAVAKVIPFSYQPLLRVADYYRAEGLNREAAEAYRRCMAVEDNPYARIKLAIVLLEEERPRDAEAELVRALELAGGLFPLPAAASSGARYLMAVALAKQSRFPGAVQELERALAIDPANAEARDLLAQLRQIGGR